MCTDKQIELTNLGNEAHKKADEQQKKQQFSEAAENYFDAAYIINEEGEVLLAAHLYLQAFLCKLKDKSYMKDKPNIKYLGNFEKILLKANRLDLLIEGFKQVNSELQATCYIDLKEYFFIKEKKYRQRQLLFSTKIQDNIKSSFYLIWYLCSSYGKSSAKLICVIFIYSMIQTIILLPASNTFMESFILNSNGNELKSFADYWYFSISNILLPDSDIINPINAKGHLIGVLRLVISILLVAFLVDIIVKKFSL